MVMLYFLFTYVIKGTFYPAIAFLSICYGVQLSIVVSNVLELFVLKDFGLINNFMALINPLGAFLFSAILSEHVYDNVAAKQHVPKKQ
ncbi:hypothetical protein Lalb_Chr12g0198431 [Lupinus albus]|uniref:Uncharacterized protein n=1 Tax=Lupinus albus TaxID=3870 RepID=A0A6A4PLC3_LUPAL|nr:hypothetical protein Lalb_Chr12g0198431 [Lupinus albus]